MQEEGRGWWLWMCCHVKMFAILKYPRDMVVEKDGSMKQTVVGPRYFLLKH